MADYEVTFPDGHVEKFNGPTGMSQLDQQNRAIQERGVAEGKIPTTFWGGVVKGGGAGSVVEPVVQAAGTVTGNPAIIAAAPLAKRTADYAAQTLMGQHPDMPSAGDIASDVAVGAVTGYGPSVASKALKGLAGTTVAHVSPVSGSFVKGATGHGILPWAVRTAGEGAQALAEQADKVTPEAVGKTSSELFEFMKQEATKAASGVKGSEVDMMRGLVKQGFKPSTAASIVASKDPTKISALLKLYLRPVVGLKP